MREYMAAGRRHGGEVRERRESHRKGEYEYDRTRNGYGDYGRGGGKDSRVRDGRVRVRVVRRDSRSNSASGDVSRLCELSIGAMDREPGELSTESGSDESIGSESRGMSKNASKLENGTRSSLQSKKRKFDELSNLSKSGVYSASNALPLPPALPKSYGQSPRSIGIGGSHVSPVKDRKLQRSEPVVKPRVDTVSDVSALQEQLEDEDYARLPDIRSSRWATDADSPADEGEIVDGSAGGIQEMRKATSLDDTIEMRVHKTSISPEFGERKTEGSQGSGARSSEYGESGVFSWSRSSSKDDFTDKNLDNNEYMELDGEYNNDGTSVNHTDTYSEDERDSPDMPETTGPPRRSVNMLQGCRNVDEYERLKKVNEGTYGVVYKARDKKTGEIVALKKVKMEREREGFPITSLREINILRSFDHPSIVDVKEVVVGSSMDSIFMVMEYMEYDLKARMDTMKHPFSETEVKRLMLQLLEGVKYLHDNWVLHRDLKTSNLLLNDDNKLKICDFGMARQYGSPLKPYTHLVVTLWYRAPELLLGAKQYSTAVDMWSVGCIMAELLSKQPLFCGKTEIDQLDKIFKVLGTPDETFWPGFSKLPGVKGNFIKHPNNLRKKFPAISCTGAPVLSEAGFDLLSKLLTYSPEKRITADDALRHKWFHEAKGFMPTFPAQHAIGDDCEDYL